MQLQGARQRFASRGLGIASVSYDDPAVLAVFAAAKQITFPMLGDPGSRFIREFRMVDPDNTPNNVPNYGAHDTAYPGYFVLSPAGVITERFIDGRYDDRRTGNAMIATLFPELLESGGRPTRAPHLEVTTGKTDGSVTLGTRLQLLVDIRLPRRMHLYAPGVQGYRPLALTFDPSQWFRTLPPKFPASHTLELKAIKETVPVYEGHVRVVVDVIIANTTALMRTLAAHRESAEPVTMTARLQYQACDDKVCYRPEELPLSWTVLVKLPEMGRTMKEPR